MNQLQSFPLTNLDSMKNSNTKEDSATPRIVKNIERMSERYRDYIDSQLEEESKSQAEQAEKVEKLKGKSSK